jgi:septal ring factor EnvC (AmiA/AmiB activator)
MREIFSAKEVELAEVHSELAYPQQETETAKEELTETQRELTQARSEMKESQTRVDWLCHQLEKQEQDYRAEHLQEELGKVREIEELRGEFDWKEDSGTLWWRTVGQPKRETREMQQEERSYSMAGTETGEMSGDAELPSPVKSHSTGRESSWDQESSSDPTTTEPTSGACQEQPRWS